MKKTIMATFIFYIGMAGAVDQVQASPCSGQAVNSCSAFNFTSSQCSEYYMNSGIQCKWNDSYCSDGGSSCTANPLPKCEGEYYGSACPTSQDSCGTLSDNAAYITIGAGSFQCTWDEGHSPANCSDSGAQCIP